MQKWCDNTPFFDSRSMKGECNDCTERTELVFQRTKAKSSLGVSELFAQDKHIRHSTELSPQSTEGTTQTTPWLYSTDECINWTPLGGRQEKWREKKIHLGRLRTLSTPAQLTLYMFMKFKRVAETLVRVHVSCT